MQLGSCDLLHLGNSHSSCYTLNKWLWIKKKMLYMWFRCIVTDDIFICCILFQYLIKKGLAFFHNGVLTPTNNQIKKVRQVIFIILVLLMTQDNSFWWDGIDYYWNISWIFKVFWALVGFKTLTTLTYQD